MTLDRTEPPIAGVIIAQTLKKRKKATILGLGEGINVSIPTSPRLLGQHSCSSRAGQKRIRKRGRSYNTGPLGTPRGPKGFAWGIMRVPGIAKVYSEKCQMSYGQYYIGLGISRDN